MRVSWGSGVPKHGLAYHVIEIEGGVAAACLRAARRRATKNFSCAAGILGPSEVVMLGTRSARIGCAPRGLPNSRIEGMKGDF